MVMDINTVSQIVGIAGGIIAILRGLQELIRGIRPGEGSVSYPVNIMTKLMIAIGIVIFLYGGTIFIAAGTKVDSIRQVCLQGQDPNSYNMNQVCNQYVSAKYNAEVKPGLVIIGAGFILIAAALFIRSFVTPSVFQFTVEIIWLMLGIWLIKSNL
jgi:hypothetical protein